MIYHEIQKKFSNLYLEAYLFCFILLVLTISVFTIDISVQPLRGFYPSFAWLTVSLYTILLATILFKDEYKEGVIDRWILEEEGGILSIITAKVMAQTASLIVTNLLLLPIVMLFYEMTILEGLLNLALIAVTMPSLVLLSMLVSCLTLNASTAQLIVPLLLLPLLVPIIIFGSQGSAEVLAGGYALNTFIFLFGQLVLAVSIFPALISKALYYANG